MSVFTQQLKLSVPNSGLVTRGRPGGHTWHLGTWHLAPAVAWVSECRAALEKKAGVIVI